MRSKTLFSIASLTNVAFGAPFGKATSDFSSKCAAIASSLSIPQANVSSSALVTAGTILTFNTDPTCSRTTQNVTADICRVILNVATSNRSSVRMEAWLPPNWTGRFLSTGNGGLGGCIQYEDLAYTSSLGFASVGTNNGHDGRSGLPFLNNADVVEDFAYRALHTGVVVGKKITASFYGSEHSKSYYLGCSTGGRQGMKEAQAFPDDFDGIVAGAPAMAFNNLTSWSSRFLPLVTGLAGSPTFIPLDMWPTIAQDILDQCDANDGLVDGIMESPDLCDYNPKGLACGVSGDGTSSGNSTSCLTATQIQTLKTIYSPLLDANGDLVFPRMQPGAELTDAPQTYFSGRVFGASDWFKYAIFNNASWDPMSLTPADFITSSTMNRFNIETFDGDLSPFQKSGGKLLHYHGTLDGVISSENSPRYYQHVSNTMGLGSDQLDEFYRFFPVSGMAHCSGGPGATFIGNQAKSMASLDPQENVLMRIVDWVEKGNAPETITGTAFVDTNPASGVAFKRNHCKWPARNQYSGSGDPNSADSWKCS